MDVFIGRKDDIGLVIVQNNTARDITIEAVQGDAEALRETLGYEAHELENTSVLTHVPARIVEMIEDYVEYDPAGTDFLNVIKKTPRFAMLSKQGDVVDMELRIQYGVMGEHPRFVVVASSTTRHVNACIAAIDAAKDADVLHPVLGLPDADSFTAKANIIQQFVDEKGMKASYIVAMAEGYPEVLRTSGEEAAGRYMQEVVSAFKRTFRATDVLASLGQGRIGVGLLKAGLAEVEIPFVRLQRMLEGSTVDIDGNAWPIRLKIAAHAADRGEHAPAHVAQCIQALVALESGQIKVV